jgi:SpoVK/Ycf46/Vps4 family AAA+-type ATPase
MPFRPGTDAVTPQPDARDHASIKEELEKIIAVLRYDAAVFEQRVLGKFSKRGTVLVFAGPAGPAKASAAERFAKETGRTIKRVDLRDVASKYIGETEKNLRKVFADAEAANVILFFDEADALFGKRTDVKDAHDRYANIEGAYLLQRLEDFPGLAIMAISDKRNLDEAFLRRCRFIVDFP